MKRCFFVVRFLFIVIGWLFLLLLCSCASKQRTVQQQQHKESLQTQQEMLTARKQHEVYSGWYNDSSALTEQVVIYPYGSIKFGREGFVGNAKAVVVVRQQNQQRKAKVNHTLTAEKMDSQKVEKQANMEQSAERTISKRINFASLRWGIAVICVLAAIVYWYWRKR